MDSTPVQNLAERMSRVSIGRGRGSGDTWSSLSAKFMREGEIGGGGSMSGEKAGPGPVLSVEQREAIRMSEVKRKKDFKCMERVNGRLVNVLQGLELHTGVFSAAEQQNIVNSVYELQEKGRKGQLRARTYSEPRKWMKGKGRVTIQLGCCYNYAIDKHGNPPGIIRDEQVDPLTPLLKSMIKRMVSWQVLPPTCIPNSCIINIYDKDDCIPPHIDHHDFVRPFCTVSFLSECNILFGADLKILGPGEFSGSTSIPLPLGSVLILNGNGADIAKHCVPAVPFKRISITFRKMDDRKLPFRFAPDLELQNLQPFPSPVNGSSTQLVGDRLVQQQSTSHLASGGSEDHNSDKKNQPTTDKNEQSSVQFGQNDFPLLVSSNVEHKSQPLSASVQTPKTSSRPGSWNSQDVRSLVLPSVEHRSQPRSASVQTPQSSSRPGSWTSRVYSRSADPTLSKQSPANGERPIAQRQLGQDDFPPLDSKALGKPVTKSIEPLRKPSRSLRQ